MTDDPVELRSIDTATKVAFGLTDLRRELSAELRRWRAAMVRLRLERPTLFDQLLVVGVAGVVELVVSYLKRKEASDG